MALTIFCLILLLNGAESFVSQFRPIQTSHFHSTVVEEPPSLINGDVHENLVVKDGRVVVEGHEKLSIKSIEQPMEVPKAEEQGVAEVRESAAAKEEMDDVAAEVDFPPPLSRLGRLKRAATFWRNAGPIVASYQLLRLRLFLSSEEETLSSDEIEDLWAQQHEWGAEKLVNVIQELQGFYVKTAQIISSRQDLFPEQYTSRLGIFTDQINPMPPSLARAVIEKELLHPSEKFEDIFSYFEDEPLGSASVAQVHRAVLSANNKTVAVKIQRPGIESKLLGDIANLKALAAAFRNSSALPLDYYTVFSELEKQLADEFDFVAEAAAMDRIGNALKDGELVIPRPVSHLVTRRVLVMDFLDGVPLSRARDEMLRKGIDPKSPQAHLFGRQLLSALTHSFGMTILQTGFFHADPHPGNIFCLKDGRIGLIDFGQVKQISGRNRETLCRVMVSLANRTSVNDVPTPDEEQIISKLATELGVTLQPNAPSVAGAAVAMWLFDGSVKKLPGGYDTGELSPNSPVRQLASFPQDLVLVGRSSILIKGLSARLGVPWSLAKEWAPIAQEVLSKRESASEVESRVRFKQVRQSFSKWGEGRLSRLIRKLPSGLQTRLSSLILRFKRRKDATTS